MFSECWVIYRGNNDGISAMIYKAFRVARDTHAATQPTEKTKEQAAQQPTEKTKEHAAPQPTEKTKENILIAIRPWTETKAVYII